MPVHSQKGWTLVELMVGVTIGLLLLAGITQIYTAAKHSYDVQSSLAEMQDVGRYAIDVLTHDIHMAGYWDLMDITNASLVGDVAPSPDSCLSSADLNWGKMIRNRLFGLNHNDINLPNYSCIGTDRARGDILTVRYADPAPLTGPGLSIRTAPIQGEIGGTGTIAGTIFTDHAVVAHSYYVSNAASPVACGSGSFTPPTLARKVLTNAGAPIKESLVNGVEQLQFRYGVDLTPAANPDGYIVRYVDANSVPVGNWGSVMSVQIWVLVRATCPEAGYTNNISYSMGDVSYTKNDGFRRALFKTTVSLRNCKDTFYAGSSTQYRTKCQ